MVSISRRRAGGAPILKELRRVIALEADCLRTLSRSVNGDFTRAVGLMAACRGKVIVTGIGKSGLIAQKIAATLASTGTPALYLHPAEGLHGDIGLAQAHDLVLAIGKSGESAELNAILPALKRLKIKVIVVTAAADSTLGRSADVKLITPVAQEACPLNLAPTCSTTAALAVGDALAVALMKLRGFRAEQFARLHPGGQLGKRLTLQVADLMRAGRHNAVVRIDAGVRRMLNEMTLKRAGAVTVVDRRGRLAGLVTDYDVRRALERGLDVRTAAISDIMNPRPTTVSPRTLAVEAAQLMGERPRPFLVLPVVDRRRRPVGLLHLHDIRARGL